MPSSPPPLFLRTEQEAFIERARVRQSPSRIQMTLPSTEQVAGSGWRRRGWQLMVMRLSILQSPISVILEHFMRLFYYYNCYFIRRIRATSKFGRFLTLLSPFSRSHPLPARSSISPKSSVWFFFIFVYPVIIHATFALIAEIPNASPCKLVCVCVCACARAFTAIKWKSQWRKEWRRQPLSFKLAPRTLCARARIRSRNKCESAIDERNRITFSCTRKSAQLETTTATTMTTTMTITTFYVRFASLANESVNARARVNHQFEAAMTSTNNNINKRT